MQTHTNTLQARVKLVAQDGMTITEKSFWNATAVAIGKCLENLQNLLLVLYFLVSVSDTLSDNSIDAYTSKKSLRLLYMMPILVSVVTSDWVQKEDTSADVHHTIVMKQGAFLAIDSFVRFLYPSSKKSKLAASAWAQFLPALLG